MFHRVLKLLIFYQLSSIQALDEAGVLSPDLEQKQIGA